MRPILSLLNLAAILLVLSLAFSCNSISKSDNSVNSKQSTSAPSKMIPEIKSIEEFEMPSSIRAIQAINDSTCWFTGSDGVYGYTEDGGKNWKIDSIKNGLIAPQFRAISVTKEAVHLLSVASPALLYRSVDKGENWDLVYTENNPGIFYDAMKFWDDQHGIAMGDPITNCLSVIKTSDGGKTWLKLDCTQLPETAPGEAAFAASNSNIAIIGKHVWMVSGGRKARVFYSPDKGTNWEAFNTPIIEGETMTGIFSVDFANEKDGMIIGGNWEAQTENKGNKAKTNDGGKTWTLVSEGNGPGYRSRIAHKNGWWLAVGMPGISISNDQGESWTPLNEEAWYAADWNQNSNSVWLSGKNKVGLMHFKSAD
ncbi:MAG: photosystem II stability/assembly factor-like uncharacterized protein [Limisphaerales bacterium]|jgi:photosystem II stability/assembly factor-like uncharacterized protein